MVQLMSCSVKMAGETEWTRMSHWTPVGDAAGTPYQLWDDGKHVVLTTPQQMVHKATAVTFQI